jgi:hypothetical protein
MNPVDFNISEVSDQIHQMEHQVVNTRTLSAAQIDTIRETIAQISDQLNEYERLPNVASTNDLRDRLTRIEDKIDLGPEDMDIGEEVGMDIDEANRQAPEIDEF